MGNRFVAKPSCIGVYALALLLAGCDRGGGGTLTLTEDTNPGANAYRVSPIVDVDLTVEGAAVAEDSAIGAPVGLTAFASDEDAVDNIVSYALANDANGRFSIDARTGIVSLAHAVSAIDARLTITVVATSSDGSSSSAEFTILVLPSDSFDVSVPVDIDDSDNIVAISAEVGDRVGITVNAVDRDTQRNEVGYALSDDSGGRFSIDAATGVITVARSLIGGTQSEYTIAVTATSEDGSIGTATFTIAVELGDQPLVSVRFPARFSLTDSTTIVFSGQYILKANTEIASFIATVGDGAPDPVDFNADSESWIYTATLTPDSENVVEFVLSDNSVIPADESNTGSTQINITHFTPPTAAAENIPMTDARGLALDSANGRVFVVDRDLPGIYVVDLETNLNRVFSGGTEDDLVGDGVAFSVATSPSQGGLQGGVALDSTNNRLLVTDDGNNTIVAVSLASANLGDRAVFSTTDQSVASGDSPALSVPRGIVVDSRDNRALVVDSGNDGVIEVDLSTGDRRLLYTLDEGAPSPRDIAYDSVDNRIFIGDTGPDSIVSITPTTADPTIYQSTTVSDNDPETGTGTGFGTIRGLALAASGNRLFVADSAPVAEGIVAVNLSNGNRTTVSGTGVGQTLDPGAEFTNAYDVVVHNDRLLVADRDVDDLVVVNPVSGDRTLLRPFSSRDTPDLGTGPKITNPSGVVFDESSNRLYVADDGANAIVSVNLNDGKRTTLVDSTGTGTPLSEPRGLGWNADKTGFFVPDRTVDGIFLVNLMNGAGSVVADNGGTTSDAAPAFASLRGHVAAESATSIIVADTFRDTVYRVNTATNERSVLATTDGDEGELAGVQSVVLDSANNRVFVSSGSIDNAATLDAISTISLGNGEISVLSSQEPTGTGPSLQDPRGITLDTANDRLLVLDNDLKALFAVDIRDGASQGDRTVIASEQVGNGDRLGAFNDINAIALDVERQVVYAVGGLSSEILMIDLISGDQIVISQ